MSAENKNRLLKAKNGFDKITSQNATNWKLILFWIIVFEFIASIIEFLYVDKSVDFSVSIPHTPLTELLVASMVTLFVWFFIWNIIYENKNNLFRLAIFSMIGLYFIITSDFTLQFLLQNLDPFHFFDLEFGFIFFVEFFFKLLIAYLIYQLIISLKNRV
ncbi:hypothetical protein [Arcobacter sp. LA11]|uniref:hypothetical protein n=1 Tax=Arcobacter sp. LA11 TaxID=1898176 RepID=UPI0009321267|nr:hypothetical protein [Arcobacter sp. LA11]